MFNCSLEAILMMRAGDVSSSHNANTGVTVQALRLTKWQIQTFLIVQNELASCSVIL